ncbi:hypothetical protein D3C71_344390 [compost metagenome]
MCKFILIFFIYNLFALLIYSMYNCSMICKTTITLDDKVKKEAQNKAKELKIRGGLSGYIEYLINSDLKKTKTK